MMFSLKPLWLTEVRDQIYLLIKEAYCVFLKGFIIVGQCWQTKQQTLIIDIMLEEKQYNRA